MQSPEMKNDCYNTGFVSTLTQHRTALPWWSLVVYC